MDERFLTSEVRENIFSEIENLSATSLIEVYDFIRFLKARQKQRSRMGDILEALRKEFADAGYTQADIDAAVEAVRRRKAG